jgi:hypothetical protein
MRGWRKCKLKSCEMYFHRSRSASDNFAHRIIDAISQVATTSTHDYVDLVPTY